MTNWSLEELERKMAGNKDLSIDDRASKVKATGNDKLAMQEGYEYVMTHPPVMPGVLGFKPKRHKYNVSSKEERMYNGRLYASKKEMEEAIHQDQRKQAAEIDFWLYNVPFRLPGHTEYRLDFMTFGRSGTEWDIEFIEVKGRKIRMGEIKRAQTEELFGISIKVV